jgi:drug/metabolite transporter (DMT)-like permease
MTDRTRAVVWMVVSAAAFAAMGAFVKAAEAVPLTEKVIVRNLLTLVIAAALAVRHKRALLGRADNQPLLLARSLLGLGGVVCYFYAIDKLLLADATMLTRLSPFFVAVFALAFLGERPTRWVVAGMVAAFVGGLLIIKPRFDLSVLPAVVGFGSSIFAGGAYTALRSLRSREAPETIIVHFSLVTVVGLLPFAIPDLRTPRGDEIWWLLGIGLAAALGQFGLTIAYRHAPAAEVSIYGYSMILFAALFGFAFWAEVPDLLSVAGGLLIIAGGAAAYFGKGAGHR